jgi:hypothetical protein
MFPRILGLLIALGVATSAFAQSAYSYVLSSLGSQSHSGNISLSATLGEPFPAKLAVGSNVLTVGFEQPQMQINTDTLPERSICSQQNINVPYQAWGYINAHNTFTAQLSDAAGSFTNPTNIGAITGTTSGFIPAAIPANIPAGSDYRIRIISSAPQLNGKADPDILSSGSCDSSQTGMAMMGSNDNNEFRCYPNPASDLVYFSAPNNIKAKITIFDMSGKAVLEQMSAGNGNQSLDISHLTPGVYVAFCRNDHTVLSGKIIKQ